MSAYSKKLGGTMGLIESWPYYVNKKVEQGWILGGGKNYNIQYIKNPDKDAVIKKITYQDYAKSLKHMFKVATNFLIEGEPLSLQGNGILKARRIERDESRLIPTRATLRLCKQKGRANVAQSEIKYILDDRVKIHWSRPQHQEQYNHLKDYRFHISRDNNGTGFAERFSKSNMEDDKLKYKYDFYPTKNFIF